MRTGEVHTIILVRPTHLTYGLDCAFGLVRTAEVRTLRRFTYLWMGWKCALDWCADGHGAKCRGHEGTPYVTRPHPRHTHPTGTREFTITNKCFAHVGHTSSVTKIGFIMACPFYTRHVDNPREVNAIYDFRCVMWFADADTRDLRHATNYRLRSTNFHPVSLSPPSFCGSCRLRHKNASFCRF